MPSITIPEKELTSFDLPRVCIITGARENIVFKPVKFSWYPRWVPILVLLNLIVAAIVALVLTKRVKGELPFTEDAYRRWRMGITLHALSIFAALILLFVAIFLFMGDHPVAGFASLLVMFAMPIGVWVGLVRNKNIVVQRIADGVVVLRSPSDAAAIAFRQHLEGGAVSPHEMLRRA